MKSVRGYLLALVAICIVLATSGFILVLGQAHAGSRRQAAAHAQETAWALSQAVDGELERADGVLAALKASDAAREHDWVALDRQARAAISDPNTWVVVQDRRGRQLVNTRLARGAALPRSAPPAEMWRALDQGLRHVCNLARGAVAPHITCLDLALDSGPRPQYALTVVFRPDSFQRIIARQPVEGELASLVDRKGVVIWRNIRPEQFLGRQANGPLLAALASPAPAGTLETRSLENVPMLTAYQRSRLSGWSVIVGLPLSDVDAASRGALLRGSLLALIVMVLGCGLALVLGRRVTMGLTRLSHALDASGDRSVPPATGLSEFDAAALALQNASAARARSERHQQMLIGELNHRVKNTLAIVQSLAQQSFRGTVAAAEPVRAFEARLQALGAAHNLLTREGWIAAPLREVVSNAMAPFCGGDRCRVEGPSVDVPPQMGVSLALALHELATNAVKYGALSTQQGAVAVSWTVSGGAFTLVWQEQGGPRVTPPAREGFGTRLIKRTLASQLNGEVNIEFAPEGVRCVLVGSLMPIAPERPARAGADLADASWSL